MRLGHRQNELYFNQRPLHYFNFCDMDSHEQETRYMACLRQELNYVKTNKSDEANSYDMIESGGKFFKFAKVNYNQIRNSIKQPFTWFTCNNRNLQDDLRQLQLFMDVLVKSSVF